MNSIILPKSFIRNKINKEKKRGAYPLSYKKHLVDDDDPVSLLK